MIVQHQILFEDNNRSFILVHVNDQSDNGRKTLGPEEKGYKEFYSPLIQT